MAKKRARGGHFFHPFQRYEIVDGFNLGEWWLRLKRHDEPFDYACFLVPALCDAQRSPRFLDGRVFDEKVQDYFGVELRGKRNILAEHRVQYPYAYHFDVGLLAEFLKGYAMRRGVRQVVDDVVQVVRREDGSIDHLITREHGAVGGDLYVDCTGFRGLLINLESTGIFFIQHGIEELVNHFTGDVADAGTVRSYNRVVGDCIDGVRDFLILHYRTTSRADTEFWRAAQQVEVSPELAERFELWRRRLPNPRNINPHVRAGSGVAA
jgi:hypothetical protein